MVTGDLENRVRAALAVYDTRSVRVEAHRGVVRLAGQVASERERRQMEAVAALVDGVKTVVNELRVRALPAATDNILFFPERPSRFGGLGGDVAGRAAEIDLGEGSGTTDAKDRSTEGEPFVPPTNPVIRPAPESAEGYEVIEGLAATPVDAGGEGAGSSSDGERGDEQIAEDVRRELRGDSLTTDLEIHVFVRRGVAFLRGSVATLEDAEAAEEVAARVPGVVEVREELRVTA